MNTWQRNWQRIANFIRRTQVYQFLQYGIHTEHGVLTALFYLRFAILIGVTVHFGLAAGQSTSPTIVAAQKWSCVCFFWYVILLGYLHLFHPDLYISPRVKILQVIADLVFFSLFYLLNGDPDSVLIALYLLPLTLVAHRYSRTLLIVTSALVVIALIVALLGIAIWTNRSGEVGWTLWPGIIFLITLTLATRLFRRREALDQLGEARQQLISDTENISDSWFIIDSKYSVIAADDRLLAWTGTDLIHTHCFESLRGHNSPCGDCPLRPNSPGGNSQTPLTTHFHDHAGQRFRVQVSAASLPGDAGEGDAARAILFVRNLSARESLQRELHNYFDNVDQTVDLLTSELRERTEALRRQLSTVFSASLAAVSADETASIERIISETVHTLGCAAASLRLVGQDEHGNDGLILHYAYGWPQEYAQEAHILRLDHESLVVDAFRCRQVRTASQISHRGRGAIHFIQYAARLNLHSVICFPLMVGAKPIGTLSLYRTQARGFTPEEKRLGQALANNLAICVHNFELYHKVSREAEARRRWLDVLHILSQRLTGVSQLDPLFQLVVDTTRERLNAEISSLFLLEKGRLVRKAIAGVENEWFPEESYEPGQGLTGRALLSLDDSRRGEAVLVNEVDKSADVIQSHLARYQARLPSGQVKHLLAVPLNGHDGPFGVLRVVNRLQADGSINPQGFGQDDVDLLSTIASLVAVAVDNARLLSAAAQARERVETLYNITTQFSTRLDLRSVMETILRLTISSVGAEDGNIFVLAEDGSPLTHIRIRRGLIREVPAPVIDRVFKEGLAGWLLSHKRGIIIKDAHQDSRWLILTPKQQRTRSVIAVPLIWRERVNGLLFLEHSQPGVFTQEHLNLVTASATQAAIAIENARLWEQVVEQKGRLQEYLAGLSDSMAQLTDLEGLYKMIVHAGARFLSAAECSLYVRDKEKNALVLVASNQQSEVLSASQATPISAEPGGGLAAYVAATGESLNFASPEECRAHPSWSESYCRECLFSLPNISCGTLLLVPMRDPSGEIVGVLRVQHKERGSFSEFDQGLLSTLANHAAVNIQRVRRMAELRDDILQRERQRLQGDLHDTMNILHAGVMLEAESVKVKLERGKNTEAQEGIRQLLESSRHVYRDLRGLLENLRLPIQKGEGVIPALRHYAQMMRFQRIHFDDALGRSLPPDVEYALVRIGQVALHNIVRHARLDTVEEGRARVVLDGQDDLVVLWIEDNGVGFDAETTLHSEEALGLKSMFWWAESIGGDLHIDSQPGKGTRIRAAVTLNCADEQEIV
ncbi:MAG: GAF domain-containing protein [Anaerolineae bacterium]|nr:GAF domain-containing protein [Anaerolineae bacterium]